MIQGLKDLLRGSIHFLNQPVVKEGVKQIAGGVTFAIGATEIYDIYKTLQGRKISTEEHLDSKEWLQIAHKVTVVTAKISLILSMGISRPGVFIISTLVGCVLSTNQLERLFGPNASFSVNPWHPRHVVSIAAVILAIPSHAESAHRAFIWTYKKIIQYNMPSHPFQNDEYWLTDAKVRMMTLFNTTTSRPFLHVGNQIAQFLIRP